MQSNRQDSSTILVVDDDADIREAMRDALEDEGYCVEVAPNGHAALHYLRSQALPALIFLDWNMAPMNAPQFMEEFRREPNLLSPPVILVTADMRADYKVSTGPYAGLLRKPVDLNQLFAFAQQYVAL